MRGILIGLVAVLAVGCSSVTEHSIAGRYRGKALDGEEKGNIARNFEQGFASTMSLDLKEDKTFHMVLTLIPLDGKWSLEGNVLTLKPDRVMGFGKGDGATFSSDKPMEFRVKGDSLEPIEASNKFVFQRTDEKPSDVDIP